MKKYSLVIIVFINFAACKENVKTSDNNTVTTLYQDSSIRSKKEFYKEMDIEKEIIFNSSTDTGDVIIRSSNFKFIIHYQNNKPQGVLIQPIQKKDSTLSHFRFDNRGVFIAIDPESEKFNFVGYKYLNENKGADIHISSNGNAEEFTSWTEYSNEGITYNVKEIENGKITVYKIKDGEKSDSLSFKKR